MPELRRCFFFCNVICVIQTINTLFCHTGAETCYASQYDGVIVAVDIQFFLMAAHMKDESHSGSLFVTFPFLLFDTFFLYKPSRYTPDCRTSVSKTGRDKPGAVLCALSRLGVPHKDGHHPALRDSRADAAPFGRMQKNCVTPRLIQLRSAGQKTNCFSPVFFSALPLQLMWPL